MLIAILWGRFDKCSYFVVVEIDKEEINEQGSSFIYVNDGLISTDDLRLKNFYFYWGIIVILVSGI